MEFTKNDWGQRDIINKIITLTKRGLNKINKLIPKMMKFTQNDWGQRDIINKTKILTKRGSDTIHDVVQTKYQKYPSNTILEHANILSEANKLPWGRLQNTKPHNAYNPHIYNDFSGN